MPPSKYTDEPEEEGVALLSTVHDSDSDGDDEVLPPPPPPAAPDDDDVPLQPTGTAPAPVPHNTRFDQPPPSPWKRAALLLIIGLLFFLAFRMKATGVGKEKVVPATRYSNEYKFRPAASPIITQTLKDGRLRQDRLVTISHQLPQYHLICSPR
ncbi:hypothetical protein C8F01DRAFT_146806 [Mycena amicta]|nr:hypothetical protein C8F01DRAFT_146806 [Mycena amicta]